MNMLLICAIRLLLFSSYLSFGTQISFMTHPQPATLLISLNEKMLIATPSRRVNLPVPPPSSLGLTKAGITFVRNDAKQFKFCRCKVL